MNDRRRYHRHNFREGERLFVEMHAGSLRLLTGEMFNLSLGGIGVQLQTNNLPLALGDQVQVRLFLPRENEHLTLNCLVVHGQDSDGLWGLQIMPLEDAEADQTRQKTLWHFLLEEQRREISLRRQPKSPPQPS